MENFAQLEYIMLLLIGSIVLGLGLAQISIKIAPKVGLMDIPGSAHHKKHQNPVPLTGGVVLMDTMIVMILLTRMWVDAHIWAIFISGIPFCLSSWASLTVGYRSSRAIPVGRDHQVAGSGYLKRLCACVGFAIEDKQIVAI